MRTLIVFAASLVVLAASAIEPPKPATPPAATSATGQPAKPEPEPTPAPAPEETAPQAAAAEAEEELPPLPADAAPAGPPPARFTPTEKVRADFPVSFPIDI
jgi:2-oxoglutarate dehydrogenase E2 component (dihydrolipoamide succinyltransferase)